MKIQETKLWSEFIDWYQDSYCHDRNLPKLSTSISDFPKMLFPFQEGVYRSFLRETKGINIEVIKYFDGGYKAIIQSSESDGVIKQEYSEAFMELITQIFKLTNRSKKRL